MAENGRILPSGGLRWQNSAVAGRSRFFGFFEVTDLRVGNPQAVGEKFCRLTKNSARILPSEAEKWQKMAEFCRLEDYDGRILPWRVDRAFLGYQTTHRQHLPPASTI